MWKVIRKSDLGRLAVLGGRAWTVFLVVLGLAPAAPARTGSEREPVPERIERIRTALDENGSDALGPAAALAADLQEGEEEEEKPPDWNDWDDWSDWNDWLDF